MNLLNKCCDRFPSLIDSERNPENTMSDLYFNEESDYSQENTSKDEDFRSTILQPFQFEPEQKKKHVVMRAMRKKLNIFTLHLPIYYMIE